MEIGQSVAADEAQLEHSSSITAGLEESILECQMQLEKDISAITSRLQVHIDLHHHFSPAAQV